MTRSTRSEHMRFILLLCETYTEAAGMYLQRSDVPKLLISLAFLSVSPIGGYRWMQYSAWTMAIEESSKPRLKMIWTIYMCLSNARFHTLPSVCWKTIYNTLYSLWMIHLYLPPQTCSIHGVSAEQCWIDRTELNHLHYLEVSIPVFACEKEHVARIMNGWV